MSVIFHERQESALCGQHCLNNLLQGSYFTPGDLADIAQELDQQERKMMLELGSETNDALRFLAEDSGNVDESGNFSLQVLSTALERSHGVQLNNANSELHRGSSDVIAVHDAFVLNRSAHWFTIRKLNGRFWDLNSMLERPRVIGDFYLSSMLAQFRNDGYDVFVASPEGSLPEAILEYGSGMGHHYNISELLTSSGSSSSSSFTMASTGSSTQPSPVIDPWAHLGHGQTLNSAAIPIDIGGNDNDDDDLAAAIAMSLSESEATDISPSVITTPTNLKRELPSEPNDDEPTVRIMIKACDQVPKLIRKFRETEEASFLFDWIDEQWIGGDRVDYELIQRNMILKRNDLMNSKQSFIDAELTPSSALMVKLC